MKTFSFALSAVLLGALSSSFQGIASSSATETPVSFSRSASPSIAANGKMNKEDAMNAAKDAAAGVSIKNILTTGSSTQTVPGYGSDVSELKNLFNKGQGNLLGPGQIKADCCLDKSSMDCRAVQVIYDTNSRPSWPESDFDQILGDRDHVLAGAQKPHPDISDSNEIICETITTTTPPQYEYTACEETTGVITEQCFSGWTEQLEITSLFKCINRTGNVKNITCTNPYVSSVQNYTCLEAPRQSCQIGINIDVESEYVYQCSKQLIQAKTYRCNKVLSVVATPGCEIGKMQQAQAEDHSGLGTDECNGGDIVSLKYACSKDEIPSIRIETNVKNSANFGFEVKALDFDEEREFSNCKGRWTGKTRCVGSSCTTEVKMDVYYKKKNQFVRSGSLSKVFGYQTYSHGAEIDQWTMSCVLEESSTVEYQ